MRRIDAALGGAGLLLAVYLLTLAPDVTFWDAGEFIAATRSLGIPHPPGTPLFVLLEHVWAQLLFFLPYAVATNLFSAVATVLAALLTGRMVQRATGSGAMAFAAAVAAGSMSSVWLNATETEVYAASLALGVLTIWAGEHAGRLDDDRWVALTAYLMMLGVPLHLSALVAAPVAILLASYAHGRVHWRRATVLTGVFMASAGAGRVAPALVVMGAVVVVAGAVVPTIPPRSAWRPRLSLAATALLTAAVAASALAFLYVRAQFDPAINQGNPDTLAALADVVARRQYAVSPMWPREAPAWVQVANLVQYLDWQFALSIQPNVGWTEPTFRDAFPSLLRATVTVLFLWMALYGAVELWRRDRRLGLGMLALFACGAFGVLVYLNLHPGPSIAYGLLPAKLLREARERDYFFVFGFWACGIWAGIGAVTLFTRWRRPAAVGALVACLPIVLNWRAVSRRGEPERSLPRAFAEALLESAPKNAVVFVTGDNDSYPLWYAQQVLGLRRDVTLVTVPLLPTLWYRSELARRHLLLTEREVERYNGTLVAAADVAAGARRLGLPVAASITTTLAERERIGPSWAPSGFVFLEGGSVDTIVEKRWAQWVDRRVGRGTVRPAIDPVSDYFRSVLDCPRRVVEGSRQADSARLDSVCNYR